MLGSSYCIYRRKFAVFAFFGVHIECTWLPREAQESQSSHNRFLTMESYCVLVLQALISAAARSGVRKSKRFDVVICDVSSRDILSILECNVIEVLRS